MSIKYISTISYNDEDYHFKASGLKSIDADGHNITAGLIPTADGSGGITWGGSTSGVQSIGGATGAITLSTGLQIDGQALSCIGMSYVSSNPSAANPSGYRVAILTSDPGPGNYKSGWFYFILEQ